MDICTLIKKHLYCSVKLEEMVSELLSLYSDMIRGVDRFRGLVFKALSFESSNHAKTIEYIARELDLYQEFSDCRDFVGEPWRAVESLLRDVRSGRRIPLDEFLERQEWIEKAVGEEAYQRILLPLLTGRAILEGLCIDIDGLRALTAILNKIASDEKFHESALKQ